MFQWRRVKLEASPSSTTWASNGAWRDSSVCLDEPVKAWNEGQARERGRGPWRPWSRRREDESHCKALKPSPFNGCSCIIGTSSWASNRARPSRGVRRDEPRPSRNKGQNSAREFTGTREATFPRGGSRRESSCNTDMNVTEGPGGRGHGGEHRPSLEVQHRPGGRSGRELHRGARARREAWPWATAAGRSKSTGPARSRWSRRQGRPWACRGARSSRRQGLEARRASIFGRSEHDDVGLVEVNIDSSKVCLSCQTHSVAAGKLDVSMASTVLEVHHRDVVVGLDEAPPDTRVPVETNVEVFERRSKR